MAAAVVSLAGCGIGTIEGTPVTAEFVQPVPHLDVSPACTHAPVTVEQFAGKWMTGSSGLIYFGMDGSALVQERAVGNRGSWSYQPLTPSGPCVLRITMDAGLRGGPAGQTDSTAIRMGAATPVGDADGHSTIKSVDKPGEPDTHWWRWK